MAESRKRGLKKRHWCFTSFKDALPKEFDSCVRYVIYQREVCAETKKQHWQGYIEFFDQKRIGQVKSIIGECHLEPRMGSRAEARDYCRKEDTSVRDSQVEFGLWREDVNRKRKLADMLKSDMTLNELIDESPIDYVRYHRGLDRLFHKRQRIEAQKFRKDMEVVALIGKTGTGKTRRACAEPDHYILPCGDKLWFDGYDGQKCLIIDDFYGNIKYSYLLRILDGHELQVPIKGGFAYARWTKVIITSNDPPDCWYKVGFTPALKRRVKSVVYL